jgi:hypothetical protein
LRLRRLSARRESKCGARREDAPAVFLPVVGGTRPLRAVHPTHGGRKLVRKLIASMLAVSGVGVPAALAAGVDNQVPKGHPTLVTPTELDNHWKDTKRELRKRRRAARKRAASPAVSIPTQLQQIAQCESHGDPHAVGGGGTYRGKYQFDMSTWASVGGHGDPAAAPEAEQDKRAAILYTRNGAGQWPVCGA